MSFGAAFGELIKKKRGIEQLTQQQLAVKAFRADIYKTRISELENGLVANPQAKTIDALVVALDISERELHRLNADHREPYIVDTLADYFDFSEQAIVELDLRTTMYGHVTLNHNCPLKVAIARFEYFDDLKSLVLLTQEGSRRPVGDELPDHILDRLTKVDTIYVNLWERGPQPMVLERSEFPLKMIL